MRQDGSGRQPPAHLSDGALWRRSRATDIAEDDAARYLDLAAFADGRLDPDDRERVAEWLAGDTAAADDIAAALSFAGLGGQPPAAPDSVIARAAALVGRGTVRHGAVIPFAPRRHDRPRLQRVASWASMAAAMAVASWLGFTLGVDTSLSFSQLGQSGDDGFLHELLVPSAGFLRDPSGGAQT